MVFSSLFFLYFFLALCFVAYFISKKIKYRNIVLIVFSMIFYAWGEPVWIVLLVGSVTANYFFGLLIEKFRDTKKATITVAASMVLNIGLLVFFKYIGFIVQNLNVILPFDMPVPDIKLPIGISFFTFQIISYILDCYWGKIKVQRSWAKLLMYISMFPQLVAGPIVRYSVIENEIDNRKVSITDVSEGISRIAIGLGKKVIIANNLSGIVDTFFQSNVQALSVMGSWYTVIVYAMQVYFDFSGYSDIAIGLGRIFGFHFNENFNYPFICKNITEFWQRWHISLGSFFRDYLLYVPIFGKRRKYLNLFLVWFSTGLWHGASWNFIIWGLYFGVFILFERLIGNKRMKKIPKTITHIYSKIVIVIGFGIFYFEDMSQLGVFLKNLVGLNGNAFTDQITTTSMINNCFLLLAAVVFCFPIMDIIRKKIQQSRFVFVGDTLSVFCNVTIIAVSSLMLINATNNPFLYFRF